MGELGEPCSKTQNCVGVEVEEAMYNQPGKADRQMNLIPDKKEGLKEMCCHRSDCRHKVRLEETLEKDRRPGLCRPGLWVRDHEDAHCPDQRKHHAGHI